MTKRVTYCCPFVPAEWIAAHGLKPCRIAPPAQPAAASQTALPMARYGVCSYARNFVQAASGASHKGDAIIFTTTCDQMRRSWESLPTSRAGAASPEEGSFLMHVPATWQTASSRDFYGEELKRLGRFLVRLGGESPSSSRLIEVMQEYDAKRAQLLAARETLSARSFAEALALFHRTGDLQLQPEAGAPSDGIRLALVGSPLLAEHLTLLEVLEQNGARIALDATGSGERVMPAAFNNERLADEPFAELIDAYFGYLPAAFRRPNDGLYTWLEQKLNERRVQGIIFLHYAWCDTWQAEAQRMKEWTETPVLIVGGIDDELMTSHTSGRIHAFLEMLQ